MKYIWSHGREFGDRVPPGWKRLIDDLAARLEKLIEELPEEERSEYYCDHIKEKFGGLRFSMNKFTPAMLRAILLVEAESGLTCEECGNPGSLTSVRGWWKCLCPEHTQA